MKNCKRCGDEFTPSKGLVNYCSLTCRNTRTHSEQTKKKISESVKNNYIENPDIIERIKNSSTGKKHSNTIKKKISDSVKRIFKDNPQIIEKIKNSSTGKKHTEITKKKLSEIATQRGLGGHTSKKSFYYQMKNGDTVYLQSSYEISVAKSLDKHNIEWTRPTPVMWVDENGINHRYYPDFYLPSFDVYLDPKNDYLIQKDFFKIKCVRDQNNINVIMFGESHLKWESLKTLIEKW